jgi:hypothetical protein
MYPLLYGVERGVLQPAPWGILTFLESGLRSRIELETREAYSFFRCLKGELLPCALGGLYRKTKFAEEGREAKASCSFEGHAKIPINYTLHEVDDGCAQNVADMADWITGHITGVSVNPMGAFEKLMKRLQKIGHLPKGVIIHQGRQTTWNPIDANAMDDYYMYLDIPDDGQIAHMGVVSSNLRGRKRHFGFFQSIMHRFRPIGVTKSTPGRVASAVAPKFLFVSDVRWRLFGWQVSPSLERFATRWVAGLAIRWMMRFDLECYSADAWAHRCGGIFPGIDPCPDCEVLPIEQPVAVDHPDIQSPLRDYKAFFARVNILDADAPMQVIANNAKAWLKASKEKLPEASEETLLQICTYMRQKAIEYRNFDTLMPSVRLNAVAREPIGFQRFNYLYRGSAICVMVRPRERGAVKNA